MENLPYSDAKAIFYYINSGLIGPVKDYRIAYLEYVNSHNIQQLIRGALTSGHKYEKPADFHTIFPEVFDFQVLGRSEEILEDMRDRKKRKVQDDLFALFA